MVAKKLLRWVLASLLVLLMVASVSTSQVAEQGSDQCPNIPELRFLTQNTMLLPRKKAVDERIPCAIDLITRDQSGKLYPYDIVSLQEVFVERAKYKILDAFPGGTVGERKWVSIEQGKFNGVDILDARPDKERPVELMVGRYYIMGPDSRRLLDLTQDSGLMLLSQYPIIAASAFMYGDGMGWDRWASKGALYARINLAPGSARTDCYIHVFVTHTQADYKYSGEYKEIRESQFKELKDFIVNATNYDGHPIILMGDFNVIADKPEDWGKKAYVSPLSEKGGWGIALLKTGSWMAEAGDVGDSATSWLEVSVNMQEEGTINFRYDVSSQKDHDFLIFYIDGEEKDRWSGKVWGSSSYQVQAGKHTFRWEYTKDGWGGKGDDTASLIDEDVVQGEKKYPLFAYPGVKVSTGRTTDTVSKVLSPEYWSMLSSLPFPQADVWMKLNQDSPGFTWIGKDWETKKPSPWGDLGNILVEDDGPPARLDYFHYFPGIKALTLEPKSIRLVPSGPEILYCFKPGDRKGCKRIEEDTPAYYECELLSHTVSDHLGLEAVFRVKGKGNTFAWTDPNTGGGLQIEVSITPQADGRRKWEYLVTNLSYNPPGGNGFSSFNIHFADYVDELSDQFGPESWEMNCCGLGPPEGAAWDKISGPGAMSGEQVTFGFFTVPREATTSRGMAHTWVEGRPGVYFGGDLLVPGKRK